MTLGDWEQSRNTKQVWGNILRSLCLISSREGILHEGSAPEPFSCGTRRKALSYSHVVPLPAPSETLPGHLARACILPAPPLRSPSLPLPIHLSLNPHPLLAPALPSKSLSLESFSEGNNEPDAFPVFFFVVFQPWVSPEDRRPFVLCGVPLQKEACV